MKRIEICTANQIIIIPAIGILWNYKGVFVSFAWLNFGCSLIVFAKKEG